MNAIMSQKENHPLDLNLTRLKTYIKKQENGQKLGNYTTIYHGTEPHRTPCIVFAINLPSIGDSIKSKHRSTTFDLNFKLNDICIS